MASPVITIVSKLLRKVFMAGLVAALTLAAYGLWLFGQDRDDYAQHRKNLLSSLAVQRSQAENDLKATAGKQNEIAIALKAQNDRAGLIEKATVALHEDDPSVWNRVFGDSEVIKTHSTRLERLEAMKTQTAAQITDLEKQKTATAADLILRRQQLSELQIEHRAVELENEPLEHYMRIAWRQAKFVVIAVFCAYLFGGVAVAFALYYGWATFISRRKPVQLSNDQTAPVPEIGESALVVEDTLWPGEVLWVRKGFLQAGDDALTKRRRWMLSWRTPFSCVAAGLTRMIELRNAKAGSGSRVVFTSSADPFAELAIVTVPDGGAFAIRAGFIMGVIAHSDQLPRVRRSWRFFSWQSWVTGQFGYFQVYGPSRDEPRAEKAGRASKNDVAGVTASPFEIEATSRARPCRLIVSGIRALHAENLVPREDGIEPSALGEQAGIVGFTPKLALKPVRTGSFWRYVRGPVPLFDAQFTGTGVFLMREGAIRSGGRGKPRGRDGFGRSVLKLLGI